MKKQRSQPIRLTAYLLTNFMPDLKAKLKDIPQSPGVYQFKNKNGEVIYVGKAKNLKTRVSQYFTGHDGRDQIPYLMEEAADLAYTVVNSELESLFLESTLIKQYLPKYNIQLRDDKNYAFITIDYSAEIPQIQIVRKIDNKFQEPRNKNQTNSKYKDSNSNQNLKSEILNPKSKYFGPYTAAYKIRNTLNLVRRIFPYCSAQKVSDRPCFYYFLHRCPGVCIGKISLEEYGRHLKKIEDFLAGNTKKVVADIKKEMQTASRQKQFEVAARLRDQLKALELLEEKQIVILPKKVDWDIVSLALDQGYACVNLFKVREGKLRDKENFIYNTDPQMAHRSTDTYRLEILQTFLETYYLEASSAPKEIYLQDKTTDPQTVQELILDRFSRKVKMKVPQRGKALGLIKLGETNAREYLRQWLSNQAGNLDRINQALARLKEVLHLEKAPERIEGYDISNIQGTLAVGSMVVFEKGLPAKSEYRKFRIRSKQTPDDFAMMKEMLTRRFARMSNVKGQMSNAATWPLPDLIVIDGGKGQLSAALEVLQATSHQLPAIPVIGLAKRIEEIFLPGNPDPIILDKDDPALQMLQRLRDEAHRFGISYHRDLRSRQAVKSALDDIPGIGPKTKKLLKSAFGTVKNIRSAEYDDLAAVVGERIAQLILQSL